MKIATWNVNSVRSRQQHLLDWLKTNPVDILCLQETKVVDQDFPKTPFENLGYHVYISGQKSYNGVAIFSREPLQEISIGFAPILGEALTQNFDEQKRVISGVIEGVRIVNLYVPNGSAIGSDKYEYKLGWLKILKEYLQTLLLSNPTISMCGDFNIALEDIDINDQVKIDNHIMASALERQALRDVLSLGFGDAFRKFNNAGENYSWWDYRTAAFKRNLGWRIDHHYLTPTLYERAQSCTIDIEPRKLVQPSDHTPVIVEF
jgi:exodeoxyribonuclease-3